MGTNNCSASKQWPSGEVQERKSIAIAQHYHWTEHGGGILRLHDQFRTPQRRTCRIRHGRAGQEVEQCRRCRIRRGSSFPFQHRCFDHMRTHGGENGSIVAMNGTSTTKHWPLSDAWRTQGGHKRQQCLEAAALGGKKSSPRGKCKREKSLLSCSIIIGPGMREGL